MKIVESPLKVANPISNNLFNQFKSEDNQIELTSFKEHNLQKETPTFNVTENLNESESPIQSTENQPKSSQESMFNFGNFD